MIIRIAGVLHQFIEVGDCWMGVAPVSRAQFNGDCNLEDEPITRLTRDEVLDWCAAQGVRLPTEEEWDASAATGGTISEWVKEGDVWEEVAGDKRVLRGGSWSSDQHYGRVALRYGFNPGERFGFIGFRVCLNT